jgi:rubrerythrin
MIARLLGGSIVVLSMAVFAGTLAVARQQSPVPAGQTIEDLKTAYGGETTTQARYAAYAEKAQEEGHRNVAVLFRATSEAERVHARNHKAVLLKSGVQPTAGVYHGSPASTAENLQDALRGEAYERDTLYPEMIRHATAEGQTEAIRSFTYAINAERQHASLYRRALENLGRTPTYSIYFVCPTCGATYLNFRPSPCPTCGTLSSRFKLFR